LERLGIALRKKGYKEARNFAELFLRQLVGAANELTGVETCLDETKVVGKAIGGQLLEMLGFSKGLI